MKLLGRGLRTEATQVVLEKSLVRYARFTLVQLTMKTMANHRPVTKAQPFSLLSTNFIIWAFNVRTQRTNLGSLQIETTQLASSVGRHVRWHRWWQDQSLVKQGFVKAPPSFLATRRCCPNMKFHQELPFKAPMAQAVLGASSTKSPPRTLVEGLILDT